MRFNLIKAILPAAILATCLSSCIEKTPAGPVENPNAIKATISAPGKQTWAPGDCIILSNLFDSIEYADSTVKVHGTDFASENAELIWLSAEDISADGRTATIIPNISTLETYYGLAVHDPAILDCLYGIDASDRVALKPIVSGQSGVLPFAATATARDKKMDFRSIAGILHFTTGSDKVSSFDIETLGGNFFGAIKESAEGVIGIVSSPVIKSKYQVSISGYPADVWMAVSSKITFDRGFSVTGYDKAGTPLFKESIAEGTKTTLDSIVEIEDPCTKAGLSSTIFGMWKNAESISVCGQECNSTTWGDAVFVSENSTITGDGSAAVFIVNDKITLNLKGSFPNGLLVLGNNPGRSATVEFTKETTVGGPVLFKDIAVSAQVPISLSAKPDLIAFESCKISGDKIFSSPSGASEVRLLGNYWRTNGGAGSSLLDEGCALGKATLNGNTIYGDAASIRKWNFGADAKELALEGNIFANAVPAAGGFLNCPSATSASVRGNIVYFNLAPSAAVSLVVTGGSAAQQSVFDNCFFCEKTFDAGCFAIDGTLPLEELFDTPFSKTDFVKGNFLLSVGYALRGGLKEQIEAYDKVDTSFCLENGVTRQFVHDFEYPDDDYTFTKVTEYCNKSTSYKKYFPAPVDLSWGVPHSGSSNLIVMTDGGKEVHSYEIAANGTTLEIWNLTPGKVYKYALVQSEGSSNTILERGAFETTGTVRMIKTSQVTNFRDLGGWDAMDGKKVRYGVLYRTRQFDTNVTKADEETYNVMYGDLGLRFDLDLRGDGEALKATSSPLSSEIGYERISISAGYPGSLDLTGDLFAKAWRRCLQNVRDGVPTFIHCINGADRTGMLCYVLNAILGVSESDLCKDYELTSFTNTRARNNASNLPKFVSYLKSCSSTGDLHEGAVNALKKTGITQAEIDEYRSLMLVER